MYICEICGDVAARTATIGGTDIIINVCLCCQSEYSYPTKVRINDTWIKPGEIDLNKLDDIGFVYLDKMSNRLFSIFTTGNYK